MNTTEASLKLVVEGYYEGQIRQWVYNNMGEANDGYRWNVIYVWVTRPEKDNDYKWVMELWKHNDMVYRMAKNHPDNIMTDEVAAMIRLHTM